MEGEPGLPYLFPELKEGWLAVMAVTVDGYETCYTSRCGVAADWCIAAPGGGAPYGGPGSDERIWATHIDGRYAFKQGTSMATPHVAGALAALKSMFPNLGFQQLRDRILVTADSSGRYARLLRYDDIVLDQGSFLSFDRVGLSLRHDRGTDQNHGAGVAMVQDGFGETEAIIGARMDLRFQEPAPQEMRIARDCFPAE